VESLSADPSGAPEKRPLPFFTWWDREAVSELRNQDWAGVDRTGSVDRDTAYGEEYKYGRGPGDGRLEVWMMGARTREWSICNQLAGSYRSFRKLTRPGH
jgi:hypothetical protein